MSPLEQVALVAVIVIALFDVASVLVLAIFARAAYKQIRRLNEKADGLLEQAEGVLAKVKETAVAVGDRAEQVSSDVARKAERIVGLSERVAERVAQRVDTTSALVQEAISTPMINLASVRAGIGKSLEVWHGLSKARGGNGK